MHAQPSRVREARIGVEAIACTTIAFSRQIRRKLEIVVEGNMPMVKQQALQAEVRSASREAQLCQRFNLP